MSTKTLPNGERPCKLNKTYTHNPDAEPRPYWRYDRFMSDFTGYVHHYGKATNKKYSHQDQLMQNFVPTIESCKRQRIRTRKYDDGVAKFRRERKAQTASTVEVKTIKEEPKQTAKPKTPKRKRKAQKVGKRNGK